LLGGCSALLLALGIVAYVWHEATHVAIEKATGCPKTGPGSITVIVLDITDSLGVIQKADLRAFMDSVRDQVPKYGRLDLYTVGKIDTHPLDARFSACNPGSGQDVSSALTGNKVLADRTWKRHFSDKFEEVLTNIEQEKPEDHSPILESIQSASITSFEPPNPPDAEDHLILVSDLLQYTNRVSFYGGAPDFTDFMKTQYYHEIRTELKGVKVTISIIPRQTKLAAQNKKLLAFWTTYFADEGATVDLWRPIKGGEP
jgi:hypothetical protein